jgi:hypothetical protein
MTAKEMAGYSDSVTLEEMESRNVSGSEQIAQEIRMLAEEIKKIGALALLNVPGGNIQEAYGGVFSSRAGQEQWFASQGALVRAIRQFFTKHSQVRYFEYYYPWNGGAGELKIMRSSRNSCTLVLSPNMEPLITVKQVKPGLLVMDCSKWHLDIGIFSQDMNREWRYILISQSDKYNVVEAPLGSDATFTFPLKGKE